jgi:peptidyl-tRNA hydrolase
MIVLAKARRSYVCYNDCMSNPVMYIFANRGLGMSPPKLAAQVAHAAVEATTISDPKLLSAWHSGGHYTKIVLLAEDEAQITNIDTYLQERGFKTAPIIDEGRTEIKAFSKTALGVAVVDKDDQHVKDTFSSFKIYKEVPDVDDAHWVDTFTDVPEYLLTRTGRSLQRQYRKMQ